MHDPANSRSEKVTGEARLILILLYLGYLLSFADRVIFGMVLKPIKAALDLSDSQLGLLSGVAFALSYAVFSPLAGLVVDRWSRRNLMAMAIAFWSLMTAATGVAGSFITMGLARAGVGAGEAFLHPLSVSLVSDTVALKQRARAFAFYMSAGAVGGMVALLFGGVLIGRLTKIGAVHVPLLGTVEPWEGLFLAASIPGFALAVFIMFAMREPPRLTNGYGAATPSGTEAPAPTAFAFLRANPLMSWALFGGISLLQMAAYTMTTWKVVFFERVYDWSAAKSGFWLGAVGGPLTIIGCLLAGRLIGWLRTRGYADAPFRICLISCVVYAVSSIIGLLAPDPTMSLVFFCGAFFCSYVPSVAGFAAMGEILPPGTRARLAGLHTLTNGLISNSLGPFLVGFFSDTFFPEAHGIRLAMVCTVVLAAVLGFLSIFAGLKPYRRLYKATHPGPAA
jgi:MFS family permease